MERNSLDSALGSPKVPYCSVEKNQQIDSWNSENNMNENGILNKTFVTGLE